MSNELSLVNRFTSVNADVSNAFLGIKCHISNLFIINTHDDRTKIYNASCTLLPVLKYSQLMLKTS